jgi:hypothetical protein
MLLLVGTGGFDFGLDPRNPRAEAGEMRTYF